MFTTEFHEKQILATNGDPPIRIEEWPEWKELQHLKDKILYSNGSWYSDAYSWRTDGLPAESFDIEKDLAELSSDPEEINRHRLGQQKFQMIYYQNWIDKLQEMFEQLQLAAYGEGPLFKWPTEFLRVEPPADEEDALKLLKKIRNKHQRVLRSLKQTEPLKSCIKEIEDAEFYRRESREQFEREMSDKKFQRLARLSKITLDD